jgi:aconitate hydratase
VLPLQFATGQNAETLGLDGTEIFDLVGLDGAAVSPRQAVRLVITRSDGSRSEAELTLRIDTPIEIEYYKAGGILPYVLRQLLSSRGAAA